MQVNFKGNYLNSTNVKKLNPTTRKFAPELAHFVEIDSRNKKDIKALKRVAQTWNNDSYANRIYQNAKSKPNLKTYILTRQDSNYEILESDNILGLCQLSKENYDVFCIEHLQTKPEYVQENKNREYKTIGRSILDSLKKVFHDKTLRVNYLFEKIPFYMDNGFDFVDELFGDLVWKNSGQKQSL